MSGNTNITKEFMENIISKLGNIKSSDLFKEDRIAKSNNQRYIEDQNKKIPHDYKWMGRDMKPTPRPKQNNLNSNVRDRSH